jgi:heterodisulfide reductase subunit B
MRDSYVSVKNSLVPKDKISALIDMPYTASYDVRHILDIIANDVGLEAVKKLVVKPLAGLRLVAYYGCYLVRPREITGFDDAENPLSMDKLLEALGAEVVDWAGKVDCCGGSGSFTDVDMVRELVGKISAYARDARADMIVTACGLCQANLESRQARKVALPVAYFTELMGVAFGLKAGKWFKKHIVNPFPLLKKKGIL